METPKFNLGHCDDPVKILRRVSARIIEEPCSKLQGMFCPSAVLRNDCKEFCQFFNSLAFPQPRSTGSSTSCGECRLLQFIMGDPVSSLQKTVVSHHRQHRVFQCCEPSYDAGSLAHLQHPCREGPAPPLHFMTNSRIN